jgi:gliding motility-associated-like protein
VSINTTPAGTITPASASVCAGGSALLTASTGTAYQWYHNDAIIPGATKATYAAAKAGKYNVSISDGACLERASNTVAVSISAVDTSVRILGPTTVCDSIVQLQAGTGATHQWYRDGVKLEGATSDHYTASRSGKYAVRITNQQGCTASSREVIITVLQKPTADFTVNAACAGEPVLFTNLSAITNSGGVTYLWDFAAGQTSVQRTPTYIYREPGTYEVSLTVTQNACPQNVQVVTKTLDVKKTVPGTTYGAVNAVAGVPFALEARAIGIEYNWTPATGLNNPRIQSPKVNISSDQTYIIEIMNASGCITRDTVQVKVQHSKVNAYVPTAFTPNGNGQNDRLRPVLFNIPKLTYFKVFNRWGQLVFQTSQMGEGWDGTLKGKEQPSESYRWILECVDANGNTIKRSGTSLLIK